MKSAAFCVTTVWTVGVVGVTAVAVAVAVGVGVDVGVDVGVEVGTGVPAATGTSAVLGVVLGAGVAVGADTGVAGAAVSVVSVPPVNAGGLEYKEVGAPLLVSDAGAPEICA